MRTGFSRPTRAKCSLGILSQHATCTSCYQGTPSSFPLVCIVEGGGVGEKRIMRDSNFSVCNVAWVIVWGSNFSVHKYGMGGGSL